jgi:arylsulfatase A-like enzyme
MHVIDWYPTLIKLAGGSLNQKLPIDGLDIWPMLTEKAASPHDAILSVQTPTRAALRMGDWKLISRENADSEAANTAPAKSRKNKRQQRQESVELYHLATDIGETVNLADKEPERVTSMKTRLAEFLKDAVPSGVPTETNVQ